MNNIEKYLDQACKSINGPEELRQHLRQELKEHLDEAIEALVAEGVSREEAVRQAMEGLGEPESIRDGMESVYSPGVTSLFVDKAIKWRDRKWHIAAQVGLGLIFAIGIGLVTFVMFFIVPKVYHMYYQTRIDLPPFLEKTVGFANIVWNYKWIWLLVLSGGLGLFEWKCRSDSKAHMRTMISVSLTLLSAFVAFWILFAVGASVTQLASVAIPYESPRLDDPIAEWNVVGPILPDHASKELEEVMVSSFGKPGATLAIPDLVKSLPVRRITDGHLDRLLNHAEPGSAYAWCDIVSDTGGTFEFAASDDDAIKVWLNGLLVHEDDYRGAHRSRFTAKLKAGTNRCLVEVTNIGGPWNFAIQQLGAVSSPDDDEP